MHVPDPFLQNPLVNKDRVRATWCCAINVLPRQGVKVYLVRDLTPVTGELVGWLPLATEPCSLLSGGLQYDVRFAPLLPPAMADNLS